MRGLSRLPPILGLVVGVVSLVALAIAIALAPRELWHRYEMRDEIAVTAAALAPLNTGYRFVLPPLRSSYASSGRPQADSTQNLRVAAAIAKLRSHLLQTPDADAWVGLGLGYAAQSQHNESVEAFERVVALRPWDAAAHTNLSAALAARGLPGDTVRAFDTALSAVALADDLAEAHFNVAAVAERTLPPDDAVLAWKAALTRERSAEWRIRILNRITSLTERIAVEQVDSPEALRRTLEAEVLPQWVEACHSGSSSAVTATATQAKGLIGDLAQHTQDRYLKDTVTWLEALHCSRAALGAYGAFLRAKKTYEQDRCDSALHQFESVLPPLRALNSPAAISTRIYSATCRYLTPSGDAALAELELGARQARSAGYLDLLGRAHWMRGYVAEDRSDFDRADLAYDESSTAYQAAANRDGAGAIASLRATLFDTLGDYRSGWQYRERSLGFRSGVERRWLHAILNGATRSALRDRLPRAALAFARVRLTAAQTDRTPLRVAEASISMARAEAALGLRTDSASSLEQAALALSSLEGTVAYARTRADLAIARAQTASDPPSSHARLTEALGDYSAAGSDLLRGRLLLHRGRTSVELGNYADAEKDFLEGIRSFEAVRATLAAAPARLSYFEESWELFDELLTLQVRRGEFHTALALLSRGRGLAFRENVSSERDLDTLARDLPPQSALLSFAVLERELVIWTFSGGEIRATRVPVERTELQSLISRLRKEGPMGDASAHLYDLLIGPVERSLGAANRLYVAIDPALHYVPFAALWRSLSREHLIQRYVVVMLPTLTSAEPELPAGRDGQPGALIVTAPFAGADEGLPGLPSAAQDGRRIAALYPDGAATSASVTTASALLEVLPHYRLVHFAGHAVVNPDLPQLSRLLLSGDVDGRLYAHSLASVDLRGVHTIVLAACDTAAGRTYRSEGVQSLARAFVARGVGRVVATLWQLDDAEASDFFLAVHQRLRAGEAAEDAVAAVQREWIRLRRGYDTWRTVVVVSRQVR